MLNKKIRIFSIFIFFGIAALFFPATALENSIANAQVEEEMYSLPYESSGNGYYNNNDNYFYIEKENEKEKEYYYNNDYYSYNKDKTKKDPIVKINKKLFICENAQPNEFFQCVEGPFQLVSPPGSVRYVECNEQLCPLVDESDFGAQLFKDVATIQDLSPQGTPVNLDKLHYTVTEGFISDRIGLDNLCETSGFSHSSFKQEVVGNNFVSYNICVNYVGDCEGTIHPGEVKTCTIENYIHSGFINFPQTTSAIDNDDNSATTAGSTTPTTSTQ
jgi:hypothetical protein